MTDANAPALSLVADSVPVVVESSPLRATVECLFATESSRLVVRYSLCAAAEQLDVSLEADWHEQERRLQWTLPTDLRSLDATCGTQFGHVRRARHSNTSWDIARFEVCAHRYVAVSEPAFGAAILADGPRGYDIRGNSLRLTVLRSPRFPDPEADLGAQRLTWAVMLTSGDAITNGIEETAARIAYPHRIVDGTPGLPDANLVMNVPGALVSAMKPADDDSGDIIIRLWETRGARTSGTITITQTDDQLHMFRCDALENAETNSLPSTGNEFSITLRPFEITTLRVTQ